MLENGADPNAVVAIAPENALSLAASLDESGFLQELLVHKANPNATFSRSHETAIFTAAFYDKTNNILMLLKNGADPYFKNKDGVSIKDFILKEAEKSEDQLYYQDPDFLKLVEQIKQYQ